VSLFRLLDVRSPPDFAPWFRFGAEYVRDVTDAMGFDAPPLDDRIEAGVAALGRDDTDPDPAVARLVAADLFADAAFAAPFCEWTPLWYELSLAGLNAIAERRLRRLGTDYAAGVDHVTVPRFSRPADVLVDGRPATDAVSGFGDRFVFADAVLHLEWYVHVAREAGVAVPRDLVDRAREETVAHYAGRDAALSPRVREFQYHLFSDDEWVRRVDDAYGLDSWLFGVWERLLREERAALAD
jgi:hypothetical protein